MSDNQISVRGFGKVRATIALLFLSFVVAAILFHRPIRRFIRESLMQRVTSAHYQILCPPGDLTQEAMTEFAAAREPLFEALNRRLNDAASNAEIRLIFDPRFTEMTPEAGTAPYQVAGTMIRTGLQGRAPFLDPSADAEATLYAAWGKPGNPMIAHWTALWLAGPSTGEDLGMAAAQVEQRLGHRKVADILGQGTASGSSPQDIEVLGAAWISEVAELSGSGEVQKLYSTRMSKPNFDGATKALATTPIEIERKWQMWIYSYVAGMPSEDHTMTMPMNMDMSK